MLSQKKGLEMNELKDTENLKASFLAALNFSLSLIHSLAQLRKLTFVDGLSTLNPLSWNYSNW